jgi:ABC-type Fe3+ transport system substrate-binding protein
MNQIPPESIQALLSLTAQNRTLPGKLDFLGRMPVPLRRSFKAGLDQTVSTHRTETGIPLECCFLSGAEWYRPFDTLSSTSPEDLPGMLVTTLYHDVLHPGMLEHFTPVSRRPTACHPICQAGGILDPSGTFRTFAVVPFVFLIDEKRLKGRPAPRCWADLFAPIWANEIVFGGWRPNSEVAYHDYNSFLLFSLWQEYGEAALQAFAANVRLLQHNIRTASQAGSNSHNVGAISILPWLQAELCPRRERTRVIWPEDGALSMPIGYMIKQGEEERVTPIIRYLEGQDLGTVLARNCYPPTNPAVRNAFPEGARLKWAGWDYLHQHNMAAESRKAASLFFSAQRPQEGIRICN